MVEPTDDELLREAWVGTPFTGIVAVRSTSSGSESLVIDCAAVRKKYGSDAQILDDGRSVGISVDDCVAFGVVSRKGDAPIAVNVWRTPENKRIAMSSGGRMLFDGQSVSSSSRGGQVSLPLALRGMLTGVVRSKSQETGNYFINCTAVYKVFQKDAVIRWRDIPEGLKVGDDIVFEVSAPFTEGGTPFAKDVRRAAPGVGQRGFMGRHKRGVTMLRMLGSVQAFSMKTGRHRIFCQDISDVYGRDAEIPQEEAEKGNFRPGDRISFEIEEPGEFSRAPILAWNVQVVAARGEKRRRAVRDGDGEDVDGLENVQLEDEVWEDDPVKEVLQPEATELHAIQAEEALLLSTQPKRPKQSSSKTHANEDPTTTEGWVEAQDRLFGNLPPLKDGWIRIRSKSSGLVYYYSTKNGESTSIEPRR